MNIKVVAALLIVSTFFVFSLKVKHIKSHSPDNNNLSSPYDNNPTFSYDNNHFSDHHNVLPDDTNVSPDDSTLSNILELQTKHFHLDIEIDFDLKCIKGQQTLTMIATRDQIYKLNLDINSLDILSVTDEQNNSLQFETIFPVPNVFGEQLTIHLITPTVMGQLYNFTIEYLAQNSTAASWLTPQQTASQILPYMYTQCQSVACRSLAPFQDTPFIKSTYSARVWVKDPIRVYLSANMTGSMRDTSRPGYSIYSFQCDILIPSYLFTIVAGNVVERQMGRRTYVISEPTNIEYYSNELSDLELYLDTIEEYTIPYAWGTYKIVIQPPSFPMGGMENPLLTFASPSIIVGDKSGVSVAVHEIAHSWSGNLVTCENWRNLWINEGFTMYLERKTDSLLFGKDYALIDAVVGNDTMIDDMNGFGLESNYTSMYPITRGVNPDDSFSNIPYEKGYQFLIYIESLVGEAFLQKFLRQYFTEYANKSIGYKELEIYFSEFVKKNDPSESARILSAISWDTWVTKPGLPPINLSFTTPIIPSIKSLAQKYIELREQSPENYKIFFTYTLNEKCIFLQYLFDHIKEMDVNIIMRLDSDYQLTSSPNKEISWRWFRITIRLGYSSILEQIDSFLGSIGRIKMISPIYLAFVQSEQTEHAITLLEKYSDFYHPLAIIAIKRIIYYNI